MPWTPWSPRRASPNPRAPAGPSTPALAERQTRALVMRASIERRIVRRERWATALLAVLVSVTAFSAHLSTERASERRLMPICIQAPGMQLACAAPPVAVERHGVLAAWFQRRLLQPTPGRLHTATMTARIGVRPAIGGATMWRSLGTVDASRQPCAVVGRTLSGAVLVQCGARWPLVWRTIER